MANNRRKAIKATNKRKQQKSIFIPHSSDIPKMSIYRIDGDYIVPSNETHFFVGYKDNKTNIVRAVQLTHLYNKDKSQFDKLSKGLYIKERFNNFETPSGVNNYYYTKNKNGGKIVFPKGSLFTKEISEAQARRIYNFANVERK